MTEPHRLRLADLTVRIVRDHLTHRSVRLAAGALVLVALPMAAGPARAQGTGTAQPLEPSVVMSGEGLVQAVPDRAWVTITAESRAGNPREAQRRNVEAMTPVQAKLKAAGIPADAIRTVGYDVQQEFDFVNNKRISRGYVARNSIDVRIDQVERVGEMLEIAVGSGATSVGGIRFDLKERAKLEREAVRLAVADARAKAEAAAAGAGVTVTRILRIDEQGVVAPPMPYAMRREVAMSQVADGAAPPIATGQMEIRATVTVTAGIK